MSESVARQPSHAVPASRPTTVDIDGVDIDGVDIDEVDIDGVDIDEVDIDGALDETVVDAMLDQHRLLVTVGAGGVGKTTTAAALAVAAAVRSRGRVLVLTIDPAKRLADAFGLNELSDAPQRVPTAAFADGAVAVRGELWAAMLDTQQGWNELIDCYSPNSAARDAIKANRLYQNLTSRFVHSHGYLAMERLFQLTRSGEFDTIIIDTPPSRNTIDMLDAPDRMREFFSSRLIRWLTMPYRSRMLNLASKPFYQVADRVLGGSFLSDVRDFFVLFQQLEPAFVAHASEVEALLRDDAAFVLVTTLEAAPTNEAMFFAAELRRRGMGLAGILANRTVPRGLAEDSVLDVASALEAGIQTDVVDAVASAVDGAPADIDSTLRAIGRSVRFTSSIAREEARHRSALEAATEPAVINLPLRGNGIHHLGDLYRLVIDGTKP